MPATRRNSPHTEARMTADNRNGVGKILKQQRLMIPLTLSELARASGVSSSHLGRIEKGQRFPSASILRRIAKPLGFDEAELFIIVGFLPKPATVESQAQPGRLDPYVAAVLSQEPVQIQRTVVTVLIVLKSLARGVSD